MLSEIMFAGVSTKREKRLDREPGLTISGLFPCAYRMYRSNIEGEFKDEISPQQALNLDDGWDQEEQAVRRLAKHAKVQVIDREFPKSLVYVGKSKTSGRPDGSVVLNSTKYNWEFKAMNQNRFLEFSRWGLKTFPGYKAQNQGYILGKGLTTSIFQSKWKDSNDYYDIECKLDKDYIGQIVDWVDRIKLDGWVPEPVKSEFCPYCGVKCFGISLDMSWIGKLEAKEVVEKWKEGDRYRKVGDMLVEQAREFLKNLLGDRDTIMVEDLKVSKIIQHRYDVSKQLVLENFGADGLAKVLVHNDIPQVRITQRKE